MHRDDAPGKRSRYTADKAQKGHDRLNGIQSVCVQLDKNIILPGYEIYTPASMSDYQPHRAIIVCFWSRLAADEEGQQSTSL